jgi:hypothetical protein
MTKLTDTLWSANPFESIVAELQGMTKPSIKDEVIYHTDYMVSPNRHSLLAARRSGMGFCNELGRTSICSFDDVHVLC